jgi:hypothetical protein
MTDGAPTGATAGADEARSVLARSPSVLLIDWPSRDVPATLAAAGFTVIVKGGPGLRCPVSAITSTGTREPTRF